MRGQEEGVHLVGPPLSKTGWPEMDLDALFAIRFQRTDLALLIRGRWLEVVCLRYSQGAIWWGVPSSVSLRRSPKRVPFVARPEGDALFSQPVEDGNQGGSELVPGGEVRRHPHADPERCVGLVPLGHLRFSQEFGAEEAREVVFGQGFPKDGDRLLLVADVEDDLAVEQFAGYVSHRNVSGCQPLGHFIHADQGADARVVHAALLPLLEHVEPLDIPATVGKHFVPHDLVVLDERFRVHEHADDLLDGIGERVLPRLLLVEPDPGGEDFHDAAFRLRRCRFLPRRRSLLRRMRRFLMLPLRGGEHAPCLLSHLDQEVILTVLPRDTELLSLHHLARLAVGEGIREDCEGQGQEQRKSGYQHSTASHFDIFLL